MTERITAAAFKARKPKAPRVDREGPIHKTILRHLRREYPSALIHHSPNQTDVSGKLIARAIAKQKAMGMVVGFPDLIMVWRGRFWAFEVKAEGGRTEQSQKDVGAFIEANGGKWAVVRSVADVDDSIAEWMQAGVVSVPIVGQVIGGRVVKSKAKGP